VNTWGAAKGKDTVGKNQAADERKEETQIFCNILSAKKEKSRGIFHKNHHRWGKRTGQEPSGHQWGQGRQHSVRIGKNTKKGTIPKTRKQFGRKREKEEIGRRGDGILKTKRPKESLGGREGKSREISSAEIRSMQEEGIASEPKIFGTKGGEPIATGNGY